METYLIMAPLNTRLKTAQRIAADASPVAMALFRKPLSITAKSDDSPVTIADQNTEKAIRAALEISFPGETIFGEEFGQSGNHSDMWIVDPIDGTRSFVSGLPLLSSPRIVLSYFKIGTTWTSV